MRTTTITELCEEMRGATGSEWVAMASEFAGNLEMAEFCISQAEEAYTLEDGDE